MARKPYYKLIIGGKPWATMDMQFGVGRVMLKVSEALPKDDPAHDIFSIKWGEVLCNMQDYMDAVPAGWELTEPEAGMLAAAVAGIKARRAAKAEQS